jgi:DeoR family transcriptional regulator, fructose operon transcriptional repressor
LLYHACMAAPDANGTSEGSAALPATRQSRLLQLVQRHGQVTVNELVSLLDVSRDTIRRDLDLLEERDLLVRTHGGAVRKDRMVQVDTLLGLRMDAFTEAKRRIGERTAALVRDGETLLLNGGSTTWAFAAALGVRRDLTVITNNLRVPPAVPEGAARAIHLLGGTYGPVSQVTVGPIALPGVAGFSVDTAVIGVTGISLDGFAIGRLEEATITADMVARAKRTIVVADGSKFHVAAFATVAPFERVQHLVTDAAPPPDIGAALDSAGVQIVVC